MQNNKRNSESSNGPKPKRARPLTTFDVETPESRQLRLENESTFRRLFKEVNLVENTLYEGCHKLALEMEEDAMKHIREIIQDNQWIVYVWGGHAIPIALRQGLRLGMRVPNLIPNHLITRAHTRHDICTLTTQFLDGDPRVLHNSEVNVVLQCYKRRMQFEVNEIAIQFSNYATKEDLINGYNGGISETRGWMRNIFSLAPIRYQTYNSLTDPVTIHNSSSSSSSNLPAASQDDAEFFRHRPDPDHEG